MDARLLVVVGCCIAVKRRQLRPTHKSAKVGARYVEQSECAASELFIASIWQKRTENKAAAADELSLSEIQSNSAANWLLTARAH